LAEERPSFDEQFATLFDAHFHRIYRYLDRLSGDAELASDLTQEAFVRLYQRGSLPNSAPAWLITVALNLFRNERSTRARRRRLLIPVRQDAAQADSAPSAEDAAIAGELRRRVRAAIDGLPERDRSLLLLRMESYSYHEIAQALKLNEASVGTLLARARRAFREAYEGDRDAP
jgi:RNA polymerase sigma-70 factor (ECF subfamily)